MESNEEQISFFSKKSEDVTVGESMGIAIGVAAITAVFPILTYIGIEMVKNRAEAKKVHKLAQAAIAKRAEQTANN